MPSFFRHGLAQRAACRAVSSGVERRAGDHSVGAVLLHRFENFFTRLLHIRGEIRVAANHGGNDFSIGAQSGLQSLPRADDAFADLRMYIGLLFTADSGVELIYIVYDSV